MNILSLLRDPLFQVNLMLWATISRPEFSSAVPSLYNSGYVLRALSQQLSPGPDLRGHFMRYFNNIGPPAPDLLLASISNDPWLIVECKANSFSQASSTADQATKLLMLGADIGDVLALDTPTPMALVTYVVPFDVAEQQLATLEALQQRVSSDGVRCASYGVFSIDVDQTTIGLRLLTMAETYAALPNVLTNRIIVLKFDEAQDPRPLYFLPFDPSITQHSDESSRAKSQLLQRAYVEIVAEIARSKVPERITVDTRDTLQRITFGVSKKWRGPDALKTATIIADNIFRDIRLCSARVDAKLDSQLLVSFTISSIGIREQLVEWLLKPRPTAPRTIIDERQQDLFDF